MEFLVVEILNNVSKVLVEDIRNIIDKLKTFEGYMNINPTISMKHMQAVAIITA